MSDIASTLSRLLSDSTLPVDPNWVAQVQRQHPAFILPVLLLLKRNPGSVDADTLQRWQSIAVLNCPDPLALTDFVDPTSAGWSTFYPEDAPHQSTTEETIDDFLATFGHTSSPEEDALLERLLFNPVAPDYFSGTDTPYDPSDPLALPPELVKHDDSASSESAEHLDAHLHVDDEPSDAQNEPEKASQPADDSLLTESLAKIYIKRGRYERAFEIISKLSLNYPEKSVYFADQLRFLQKLMINQRYLDK